MSVLLPPVITVVWAIVCLAVDDKIGAQIMVAATLCQVCISLACGAVLQRLEELAYDPSDEVQQ